jgi:hypothetical protein
MSGITDSAKFNKNSSYYVEVDPTGGGGQIIQGNLQVTGNISAGGDTTTAGLASSGSLTVAGASSLGSNGISITTVGAGGLAVVGPSTMGGLVSAGAGLAVTGNTVLTGALTATGLTTAGGGLSVNGVTQLGGALTVSGATTLTLPPQMPSYNISPRSSSRLARTSLSFNPLAPTIVSTNCIYAFILGTTSGFGFISNPNWGTDTILLLSASSGNITLTATYASPNTYTIVFSQAVAPGGFTQADFEIVAINTT